MQQRRTVPPFFRPENLFATAAPFLADGSPWFLGAGLGFSAAAFRGGFIGVRVVGGKNFAGRGINLNHVAIGIEYEERASVAAVGGRREHMDVFFFEEQRGFIDFGGRGEFKSEVIDTNIAGLTRAGRFGADEHQTVAARFEIRHIDAQSVMEFEAHNLHVKFFRPPQVIDAKRDLTNARRIEHVEIGLVF